MRLHGKRHWKRFEEWQLIHSVAGAGLTPIAAFLASSTVFSPVPSSEHPLLSCDCTVFLPFYVITRSFLGVAGLSRWISEVSNDSAAAPTKDLKLLAAQLDPTV
eukprot:SAG31_NODE_5516_length_2483_cov_6.085151_1_plen_104_part_00